MITGLIFSALAGILMSLQGVFNTRVSEKIGLWETTVIVNLIGLIVSALTIIFFGSGGFKKITEVNYWYLLGGVLGVGIVYTVMHGISKLGTTCAVAAILIAQLLTAAIIDGFNLFGAKHINFDITKIAGIAIMIAGIVVFKCKG